MRYNYNFKNQRIIKIAITGRISYAKAWDFLLKVILKIKDQDKFIFNWYGSGEDEISLKKKINDNHLQNTFKLHGRFSNINEVLKKNDIFLFSSRFEGGCLPRGLQEAMYFGIPCIIPTIPSIMEKIKNKKFYFKYKTENVTSLTQALSFAHKNQKKFKGMSEKAHKYIEENHSALRECQETSDLYSKLIKNLKS